MCLRFKSDRGTQSRIYSTNDSQNTYANLMGPAKHEASSTSCMASNYVMLTDSQAGARRCWSRLIRWSQARAVTTPQLTRRDCVSARNASDKAHGVGAIVRRRQVLATVENGGLGINRHGGHNEDAPNSHWPKRKWLCHVQTLWERSVMRQRA